MLTSLDFLATGQQWPPVSETERLKLYRDNKLLFKGSHDKVFKDWVRILREDQKAILKLILNWNKRLTLLWADLLLSEPPYISAGEPESPEQAVIDRYIDNKLLNTAYEVAIDISRFGHGVFKTRYDGTKAVIEGQPPEYWFPVFNPDNAKEIVYHVFAWTFEKTESLRLGLGARKNKYLKCEIHEPGKITTRLYMMNGERVGSQVEKDAVVATGIKAMPVVVVSNIATTDSIMGLDDYTDLDSIIQEIETRLAQISRVLDKHSDPNMYGPDTALEEDPKTGQATFKGGGKYFPISEGDQIPGYVVWEGQLEAAFRQIELLMSQLFMLSETSAACFGEMKAGLAESGSALKRLMVAPLAKAARIRMNFDPGLREIIKIASELEVAQGMTGSVKIESLDIEWNDGLPEDNTETIQNETTAYGTGITSLESSVKRTYGIRGKALQEELDKIKADRPETPEITPVVEE